MPCVVHGIGDDAAVLKLDARRYQLFTTDMLVEGIHFTLRSPAKQVGYKALACNISDIAAMGGLPTCAVVSIGLPSTIKMSYVQDLYLGMAALAAKFSVSIVGGDTVKSDQLTINIALLGEVEKKHLTLRSGAKPGDMIFVSGALGNTLKTAKHLNFMPRIKEARFLVQRFRPSAMMDISDGLAGDLGHILKASGVGAVLEVDKIPKNPGATLDSALTGGEDFELLFTLPPARGRKLIEYTKSQNEFTFAYIGVIFEKDAKYSGMKLSICPSSPSCGRGKEMGPNIKSGECFLKDSNGAFFPLEAKAYTHF